MAFMYSSNSSERVSVQEYCKDIDIESFGG
jgi:hypothetical protein